MSGTSTAVAASSQRAPLTPLRNTPSSSSPAVVDSPGNWQHPRIDEITRRQNATTFTSDNVNTIIYNVAALFTIAFIHRISNDFGPRLLHTPDGKWYVWWTFFAFYVLPCWNIIIACLPLIRAKDDLSDIPLTPAQRQLLGLPPSSRPATPDAKYNTPPRYSRTPSIAGSAGMPSPSSSPLSAGGSPLNGSRNNGSPYSPAASPLLQKAVGYSPRRSMSQGSQSPFNNASTTSTTSTAANALSASTTSFSSSVFSEPPATPSPPGGKRISVGLNNKWLYERSRRTSGNVWS